MKNVGVVIPTYNSAGHILGTVESALAALEIYDQEGDFEIIVVDDGSTDNTAEILKNIAVNDPRIKVIELYRNFGQHAAIFAGCSFSNSKVVLFTDDDLLFGVEQIGNLVAAIEGGADVALGTVADRDRSIFRRIMSIIYNRAAAILLKTHSPVRFSNFWMATELVVKNMARSTFPFVNVMGAVAQITTRVDHVLTDGREWNTYPRKSNYNLTRLLRVAFNGFFGYSILPLRLATFVGFFGAAVAMVFSLFFFANWLAGSGAPAGYTSIILAILASTSLILIVVGIVGEYLGRAFAALSGRPMYLVRSSTNTSREIH